MRKFTYFLYLLLISIGLTAQTGHDIKINLKGCTDTNVYLVVHFWESNNIVDSCKKVKNGQIQFKGKNELEKGYYILVNQQKNTTIFEFFINENQKFSISADKADLTGTLKAVGNKENEQLFSFNKFFADKNKEFEGYLKETKGKSKPDSAKFINDKIKLLSSQARVYDSLFKVKNKGAFVNDFFNLRIEKQAQANEIPKAKNGRPDSIFQYYYYKQHFFDGIDFKDERLIHTPYLDDRIKKYFDVVIVQNPDTVIQEIDKIMSKCTEGTLMYQLLIGHFTYKYEQNRTMSFDKNGNSITYEKVFVHLADKYIISGKAKGAYAEETIKLIKDKVDINRRILPGALAPDFDVIDTTDAKTVINMRFDTCKTSKSLSLLYYQNEAKLKPYFKNLYSVKAKYTVLVFWASDCGHCQTDIPRLNDTLKLIKNKIDFKVFGVQTKDDFEPWRKFIIDKKLDFINVYDPIHLNSFKDKYDVQSTPIIYILDKDKKIKAKKVGVAQVNELLELFEKISKEQAK